MTPILSVIDAIARRHSTTRACILGRDRHRSVALARKVAMYCARHFVQPQPSWHELGRAFLKDHTTCMSAVASIEQMKGGQWVAEAIEAGRRAAVVAIAFPPVSTTTVDDYRASNAGAAE